MPSIQEADSLSPLTKGSVPGQPTGAPLPDLHYFSYKFTPMARSIAIGLNLFVSMFPRKGSHNSKTTRPNFTKFFVQIV